MEGTPNVRAVAKKICNFVRVIVFMFRKGIAKRKLMVDLAMMMKRGKIAGKAVHNLMFHHGYHNQGHHNGQEEFEFSCSNTPTFPLNLLKNRKHHHHGRHHKGMEDDMLTAAAVQKVFDMLDDEEALTPVREVVYSELASPTLPGFGLTPIGRQLRVTDSPFPLRDIEVDSQVDEAAEDFISKFYSGLRKENEMGLCFKHALL